jgi:hypothetical protein
MLFSAVCLSRACLAFQHFNFDRGSLIWTACALSPVLQCGKMELLKRFAGANRSCKRGLARRRARYTHQHEQAQQQQQQQRDMVDAWQVHSDWAPAEQVPPYQKEEVSDHSQGYRQPASLAAADMVGAVGFSYEPPSCGEGSGSLEGLIDAQLEAMIEDELLAAAAAAIPGDAAGLAMRNTGMLLQMPVEVASVRAPPAAAAAAAARVGASMHHDAQNFRLHSLMGQLAELSATLQQLQQAVGLPQCADSGSDKTGYTY